MFFKTVEDAARLRLRVSECFERAALPATTPEVSRLGGGKERQPTRPPLLQTGADGAAARRCLRPPKRPSPLPLPCPQSVQERRRLLSFVIVGGGPTGVEVAAELHDLITEDLVKLYPEEVRCCPAVQLSVSAAVQPGCRQAALEQPVQPVFLAISPWYTRLTCMFVAVAPQVRDATITVIELMDHVLSMYDRAIGQYTAGEPSGGSSGPAGWAASGIAARSIL